MLIREALASFIIIIKNTDGYKCKYGIPNCFTYLE